MGPLSAMESEQQLDCALDLMRRLPPQQIEKNLSDLIDLVSRFQHLSGKRCQIKNKNKALVNLVSGISE
ncbi:hypothetical protein E2320_006143 [Naja naja]|nr:hypothetical protein E2320_006143 [Naja naja]